MGRKRVSSVFIKSKRRKLRTHIRNSDSCRQVRTRLQGLIGKTEVDTSIITVGTAVIVIGFVRQVLLGYLGPFKCRRNSVKKSGWVKIKSLKRVAPRSNSSFQAAYRAKNLRIGSELGRLSYEWPITITRPVVSLLLIGSMRLISV